MRRSQGCVYRKMKKRKGKTVRSGFFRARYIDHSGAEQDHVIYLANGMRVRDQAVAEAELEKILKRVQRAAAGLVDPEIEAAGTPIRALLARFIRRVRIRERRAAVTRAYTKQALSYTKAIIDGMDRLADFRRDTVEAALTRIGEGTYGKDDNIRTRSPRTLNAYRARASEFGAWLEDKKYVLANPVAKVPLQDEAPDIRKRRRSLSVEEATRLLDVAGPRRLFYAVQMWSGLRVNETLALQWGDLDLDGERPCIRLRAITTKARRADVLPLHSSLVTALVKERPEGAPHKDRIFRVAPRLRTFDRDLVRAGIAKENDRGETIDRHALRTTFVSWLGRSGCSDTEKKALARHADSDVTARYQDLQMLDLWEAIQRLPEIVETVAEGQEEAGLAATGTGGKLVARPVALGTDVHRVPRAVCGGFSDKACHSRRQRFPTGKLANSPRKTHHGAWRSPASAPALGAEANQAGPRKNAGKNRTSKRRDDAGSTPGSTSKPEDPQTNNLDPDLDALVRAWPALSEPIKAAVKALIMTASKGGGR